MQYSVIFAVAAVLFFPFDCARGQKCELGRDSGLRGDVQWWETVSSSVPYTQVLRGTILGVQKQLFHPNIEPCLRSDAPYVLCAWDGDWNVFVVPAPGYEWMLYNSHQKRNPDGYIELEIMSPAPLDEYFKKDDAVEAYGYFAEDFGHTSDSPKTELHPLIYLRKDTVDASAFIIAQDRSGRFPLSNNDLFWTWSVPLVHEWQYVDLVRTTGTRIQDVEVTNEESTVDSITVPMGCWSTPECIAEIVQEWNQYGTKASVSPSAAGEMTFKANLGTIVVDAFYAGKFEFAKHNLLQESITSHIDTDGNGKQKLIADVDLRLSSPPEGQLSYSDWHYAGFGEAREHRVSDPADNHITMTYMYAPAFGYTDTSNLLSITASTRPRDWYPGRRTSWQDPRPESRTFVGARRVYKFSPSELRLDIAKETRHMGSPSEDCVTALRVKRAVSLAHPQVAVDKKPWSVWVVRKSDGTVVDQPQSVTVPTSGSADLGSVKAALLNEDEITLNFENTVASNAGPFPGVPVLYGNKTKLIVQTGLTTGLGEVLQRDATELGIALCLEFPENVRAEMREFDKWVLAIIRLRALGLTPFPIPQPLPSRLLSDWSKHPTELPPPQEWYPGFPNAAKRHVATYFALMSGKSVKGRDLDALIETLKAVRNLPRVSEAVRRAVPQIPAAYNPSKQAVASPQVHAGTVLSQVILIGPVNLNEQQALDQISLQRLLDVIINFKLQSLSTLRITLRSLAPRSANATRRLAAVRRLCAAEHLLPSRCIVGTQQAKKGEQPDYFEVAAK